MLSKGMSGRSRNLSPRHRSGRQIPWRVITWARTLAVLVVLLSMLPAKGQAGQAASPGDAASPPRIGLGAHPSLPTLPRLPSRAHPAGVSDAPPPNADAAAPASYGAFVLAGTAHVIRAAVTADAKPIYGVAAEIAQPLGPYRTTISIHGLMDLQWLKAQNIPVLAVTAGTATVVVYRHDLALLAQHRFFPDHTNLVSALGSASIRRWAASGLSHVSADNAAANSIILAASPLAPTSAQVLAASPNDTDGDGLTNIEETWWCTDPNNPDSNGDGVSDGQTVQDLLDWLQHKRTTRGPGRPFSGWPVNHPGCTDSDFDSVPDAAETFMLGLNPNLESTSHDKYDDGQKLFGVTYCPGGGGGGCGYGVLPPIEIPFSQLPAWVQPPYDSPFVSAFPVIDVSVVPNSLLMTRITTITTTQGQMAQTQKSYQTAVTNEESDSIANAVTWNNWQEVSQAISQPLAQTTQPRSALQSSNAAHPAVNLGQAAWGSVLLVGGAVGVVGSAAATVLGTAACPETLLAGCGVAIAGTVAAPITYDIAKTGFDTLVNAFKPDTAQSPHTYSQGKLTGTQTSPNISTSVVNNVNVDLQGLSSSLSGIQYALDAEGNLLNRGLQDVSFAISQPRVTETHTSGQSWGGSQTTTHEVSQSQTVTNGDAFTTGSDWSTATAVDSSHAAQITFGYTIRNDGTDYADHVDNLIFNIYLGHDTTPIISYPAWQQFSGGELKNFFPGNAYTFTTTPITLTLDQMRRIDTGTPIREVVESYDFGIDQQFYQDAVQSGLTVTIDTADDVGTQPTHSYLLPIQSGQSIQQVLGQFFPEEFDSAGNVNGLWVPQYNGSAAPTWVEHFLSNLSWWHIYLSQTLTNSTQLSGIPAQPGSAILIRIDRDSDADGYPDRIEQQYGTNPNDPTSHPAPDLIAATVSSPSGGSVTPGTTVTAQLALENTGTFDAYGIQATMYAPDNTTTIKDGLVGGSGVVAASAHVAVGSLVEAPDLTSWSTSSDAATPHAGGNFTGTSDTTYTFTVGTPGGMGQGTTSMSWTSTAGGSGNLDLGTNYHAPAPITVDQGVQVWFDSGTIAAGTSFTVVAHAPEDTFSYVVNAVPYTPPMIVITYSDPQGSHRFITPVTVPTLATTLAPFDGQMLRNVGIHIWPTGAVNPTGNNTTNIVLESPAASTITGGQVYLDFVANGTVVDHVVTPVTVQPGPLVVPVTWSPTAFSQAYDPTADNILIATWTDAQGDIIDSTARPLNTFAADPTPAFNLASTTWNFGTVTQGAVPSATFTIANTGLVSLDLGTVLADPTLALSNPATLASVPSLGAYTLGLTLDTSTLSGAVSKTITILSSDPAHAQTTITITGNVSPPSGPAAAFAVPNHPLDQLVHVYGNVAQYTTVPFAHTIQPDPGTIEPCKVYDATGTTLKGVGQLCTDFGVNVSTAQLFGNGQDGPLTVSGTQVVNTVQTIASGSSGSTILSVVNTSGFAAGQEVMIWQVRYANAGAYEFNTIASVGSGELTLTAPLVNTYSNPGAPGAQVIWVPQYTDVTVNSGGTLTAPAWNGSVGGILAFLADGTVLVNGTISADGNGYFGGPPAANTSNPARYGWQGEGINPVPNLQSQSANATGGGGGTPDTESNDGGGGGGGGSYATAGGNGSADNSGYARNSGAGSGATMIVGTPNLSQIIFGGGGGSGGADDSCPSGGGGAGGGIILIWARNLTVQGTIQSNGASGQAPACQSGNNDSLGGGGGGGAGGSLFLTGGIVNLANGSLGMTGGLGGLQAVTRYKGGNGGNGRAYVQYCTSISGSVSAVTAQILCYLASKSDPQTVQFTVPDQVTNGQNYVMQFARHLTFPGGTSTQSNVIRVPAQSYAGATMDLLLTNLGAGGVSNVSVSIGGTQIYQSSQAINQSTTINLPDFTSALNTYLQANTPSNGAEDLPVQVTLTGQADALLTNMALTPGGGVDLAVSASDLSLGCPGAVTCPATEGNQIPVSLTVHNNGLQPAQSVVVAYFAGDPTAGGQLIGSSYIASVPNGGTANTGFTWDTTGFAGAQTLYAEVDPLNAVGDPNRSNNTTSQAVTILTKADLQISSISFNSVDPVVGESVVPTIVVANAGQTAAPASTTHLQVGGAGGDTITTDLPTAAIAANSSVSVQATLQPTLFGSHTVTATADSADVVVESDKTNNVGTATLVVGLGPQEIDAGGATDPAYSATLGYGYLNGSTHDFGGGTVASTVRFNASGPVQYQFDGLQPGRFYHLDATFYQTTGTFNQAIAFDGIDSGQVIPLPQGVVSTASILVPVAAYADGSMVVSFSRPSGGPAYVSELALTPIYYTYIDAGSAADTPYAQSAGYGYLGSDSYAGTLTSGATDPLDTYRSAFGGSVTYQFDGLSASNQYQVDLTLYGGAGDQHTQSVQVDGGAVTGCVNLPVSAPQRIQCRVDPSTYASDGSVQVSIVCDSCNGPYVNEIALEQFTRASGAIPPTPTSTATATNTNTATATATPSNTPTATATPSCTAPTAQGVTVTDLSPSGFAVVFTTQCATTATLEYGTSAGSMNTPVFDDRDTGGSAVTSSVVHRFTLTGLQSATTYYFEPVIGGQGQPAGSGSPYSQAVPPTIRTTPPGAQAVLGAVLLPGSVLAPAGGAVLRGYWSNPSDGSKSGMVSVLNTGQLGTTGYNYQFDATPLNAAGTDYFALTAGTSVFHVVGYGSINGVPASGGPVSATLATTPPTKLPPLTLGASCTHQLPAGWSLLSLCYPPTSPLTAQAILGGILAQTHGQYVALYGMTNGLWNPSAFNDPGDGIGPVGDFSLQVGNGYLIYTDVAATYVESGIIAASLPTVPLPAGWSLIGMPAGTNPTMAQTILGGILAQTHGQYVALYGMTNGLWNPSAFNDPGDGIGPVGDFSLQVGNGYLIYTDIASSHNYSAARGAATTHASTASVARLKVPAGTTITTGARRGTLPHMRIVRNHSSSLLLGSPLVTDLTDTTFSVALLTRQARTVTLLLGTQPDALTSVGQDDRTGSGVTNGRGNVHRFTLSGLEPNTTYYYEVELGHTLVTDDAGKPFTARTMGRLQTALPSTSVGRVRLAQTTAPAIGTVLLIGEWRNPDGSRSAPISVFNDAPDAGVQTALYDFHGSLARADGSGQFVPAEGATFQVWGYGDMRGRLFVGAPVEAQRAAPLTLAPNLDLTAWDGHTLGAPFAPFGQSGG